MDQDKYHESASFLRNNLEFGEVLAILTGTRDAKEIAKDYENIEAEELAEYAENLRDMYEDEETDIAEEFGLDWN